MLAGVELARLHLTCPVVAGSCYRQPSSNGQEEQHNTPERDGTAIGAAAGSPPKAGA